MLGLIKRFLRKKLNNDRHPIINLWYMARDERKYQRRQKMTYAEIESEINRVYEAIFVRKMNWDNPQTYNEKINVSKVYMATPEKTRLADKYLVREWIREKIGEEYLIPLLGVYDSFDEIDFDSLPDKFVIKCNHDCGSVMLVNDKSKLDMKIMKRKYDFYMKRNYAWGGLEMHYRDIKPKIIIEQYMGDAVSDYKFQCFNGRPYCCRIDYDRFGDHRRNIYNMDWEIMPFMKGHYKHPEYDCPRPPEYDDMKRIVSELSEGFDQVRVDLYLIDGRIYFGEMTFANASGCESFVPDEYDYKLSELWPFDNTIRKKVLAQSSRP